MFSIEELLQKIADCQSGRISVEQFDNWFEDQSVGAYADPEFAEVYASVDAALGRYYFDGAREEEVRADLWDAVRPFLETRVYARSCRVSYGWKPFDASTTSRLIAVAARV
jgi:hypothetical protein